MKNILFFMLFGLFPFFMTAQVRKSLMGLLRLPLQQGVNLLRPQVNWP